MNTIHFSEEGKTQRVVAKKNKVGKGRKRHIVCTVLRVSSKRSFGYYRKDALYSVQAQVIYIFSFLLLSILKRTSFLSINTCVETFVSSSFFFFLIILFALFEDMSRSSSLSETKKKKK